MWCYFNQADEVELFINGRSQGVRRKADTHQYHVVWRVTFQPGEVKVVARKNGIEVRQQVIKTAGAPHHLRLTADRNVLDANGKSLAFVTVEVVDKEGNLCPNAENQVFFGLDGDAEIAGVDNGCQTSLERFKADKRKTFHGRCLLVMRSSNRAGNIFVTAKAAGLGAGTCVQAR
jgi:beta-galactosidase